MSLSHCDILALYFDVIVQHSDVIALPWDVLVLCYEVTVSHCDSSMQAVL